MFKTFLSISVLFSTAGLYWYNSV